MHAYVCILFACARVLVLENIISKSDQVLNMTLSPTLTVPLLAAGPSSARPTIRMPACVCSCLCARACVQACMRACVYRTYTQSISPMVRFCQLSPGPACGQSEPRTSPADWPAAWGPSGHQSRNHRFLATKACPCLGHACSGAQAHASPAQTTQAAAARHPFPPCLPDSCPRAAAFQVWLLRW